MKIDMHIHTTYSDGEYSPQEILRMCEENEINLIAITDHNTIEGVKEIIKVNPYPGIRVLPGIEFSCSPKEKKGEVHILGYGIDVENKELNTITEEIREDNVRRIKSNLELLKSEHGISFPKEDIENIFSAVGNIGRPEIAKLLVKYGHVKTVKDAFDTLLLPLEDKVIKRKVVLTEEDAIYYINRAGGMAVLAHPVTINLEGEELEKYIKYLSDLGLAGIEAYHSKNPPKLTSFLKEVAEKYELLTSCGSDYHGPVVTPGVKLGMANGDALDSHDITILDCLVSIQKVHVFANTTKENAFLLRDFVEARFEDALFEASSSDPDYVVGIGGDGTLIKYLSDNDYDIKARYIGINTGTLGFLQDFYSNEAYKIPYELSRFSTQILYFAKLIVNPIGEEPKTFYCLNEFKISLDSGKAMRMSVGVCKDEKYSCIEWYKGSALICSTSTGSTANNLSAGGAILFPEDRSIQIAPSEPTVNVTAHTLKNSIVVPEEYKIELIPSTLEDVRIMADGINVFTGIIKNMIICSSDRYIERVISDKYSFVKAIRDKIIGK